MNNTQPAPIISSPSSTSQSTKADEADRETLAPPTASAASAGHKSDGNRSSSIPGDPRGNLACFLGSAEEEIVTDQILEQQRHDKRSVCSACCDSMSEHHSSSASSMIVDVKGNSPDSLVAFTHQNSPRDTGEHSPARIDDENATIIEYITIPGAEDDDEEDDNEEVPLEVSAVLVELPDDESGAGSGPPPPYTVVRGRRMRFLTQRMHLPVGSSTGDLAAVTAATERHCDLYRLQQPDCGGGHLGQLSGSRSVSLASAAAAMVVVEDGKDCCAGCAGASLWLLPESVNVRWFIVIIVFIALCCVVVGIVLGALKGANEFTGDDSLTIALLLIGECDWPAPGVVGFFCVKARCMSLRETCWVNYIYTPYLPVC